jgi:uncharacterized surface protein with fasciclin (FAS1) repeats
MTKPFLLVLLLSTVAMVFSCKNSEEKNQPANDPITAVEAPPKPPVKRAPKKELTSQDLVIIKSVMARVMNEAQLKKYASYLVTAELGTMLSEEKGPFLVFAPANSALEAMDAEKRKGYASPENKAKLTEMLKSYIVEGKDNETLMKALNEKGTTKLKTLAGTNLTVSKTEGGITISTNKGTTVRIVGNGTAASNGTVYAVDGLLVE